MPILVLNTLSWKALWGMEVHVFKRKKGKEGEAGARRLYLKL